MRRTPVFTRALLLAVVVLGSDGARASEPRAVIPADLILQRFPVAKGGAPLLVPVRFDGKDHMFLVDTGSDTTVFDASLSLGAPKGTVKTRTPGGEIEVKTYDPPVASVGTLPFHVAGPVMASDLKQFRVLTGKNIEGFLGMDFLGQYGVHIDFDRGQVLFLRTALDREKGEFLYLKDALMIPGDILPMYWEPGKLPGVLAFLPGPEGVPFLIDTGCLGHGSGLLNTNQRAVRNLVDRKELRRVDFSFPTSAAGRWFSPRVRGERLTMGGFAVESPEFGENAYVSALGLRFWSRFAVTFDFPARKVYLRKAAGYERPDGRDDVRDFDEFHRLCRGGAWVIAQTASGGPGAATGALVWSLRLWQAALDATEAREGEGARHHGDPRAAGASPILP